MHALLYDYFNILLDPRLHFNDSEIGETNFFIVYIIQLRYSTYTENTTLPYNIDLLIYFELSFLTCVNMKYP